MAYRIGAGRKPKPTRVHILNGNPGKRPLNRQEAQPEIAVPECPSHFAGEEKQEWDRVSKQLVDLGLLSVIDRAALAAYCQAWARWVEAEQHVRLSGLIVKAKENGKPLVNPYLRIADQAMMQMRAFMVEFGLTPASRSRVHAAPKEKTATGFGALRSIK